ncbi:SDR family NAD(P)-dependent oxidoreductase [Planotetraspora kaengkrachanensis]|uniref:Short-chain dehydrogenase n=1 Tax=Planotetraspora kaengkrachanensis TaxID=575193 RepID=A0A8J3M4J8_9ACTN|nr:SDR family oxidoreductase [Planotetraspora kaengkrachanensis]GIG79011.1 short-chain dehydrogenase [Planotetraspora kaengkrachanensis]
MTARLQGRSALVTGSTDGLGVAIAQALAAEGAHVIVTGRNVEGGKRTVGSIEQAGGRATFIAADLGRGAAAIRELAHAAGEAAGGDLDILVNNAALLIDPAPTAEVEEELIDQALRVNVKAAFLLTGLIAPEMAARGSGSVINMGSINGLFGSAHSALYSATKATVHSLTKSWAAEYGPAGVRVNTVAPGPTLTEKISGIQDRLASMIAAMPSRRASTPAEVAAAVVFLASDDASNIHGATLSVDGGRAAI